MAPLVLKGNTFDLAKEKPNLPADASSTNYILIEFKAPLGKDEYQKLAKYEVTVEEYVGNETYLCRYVPKDLNRLKELSFVGNFTVYPAKVKVSPELQQVIKAQQTAGPQGGKSSSRVTLPNFNMRLICAFFNSSFNWLLAPYILPLSYTPSFLTRITWV